MGLSRRSRVLALSSVLVMLLFVMLSAHNSSFLASSVKHSSAQPAHATESTTRIGIVDEGAIKTNEDKIQEKIRQGQADKSNVDKQQQLPPQPQQAPPQQAQQQQQQAGGKDTTNVNSKPNSNGAAIGKGDANAKVKQGDAVEGDDDRFDAAQELQSIMALSPVVIFSKTYCGFSRALKNLFSSEYEINPTPTVVELDKHKHGRALQDYIASKTGRKTVPNLFINGVSRGGSDEMKKLHEDGKLLEMLNKWGGKSVKAIKLNAPSNS